MEIEDIVLIIQARSGSTRLPNKMFLPFYDKKTIPEILIEKLLLIFSNNQLILSTTDKIKDDPFEIYTEKYGIKIFRGDEDNVLKRFIDTATTFNKSNIIRICADNPFLDLDLLTNLISNASKDYDYCSYQINKLPSIKTHYGFFAEYVSLDALRKVEKLTVDSIYTEHVTNFIYSNKLFNIKWIEPPTIISGNINIRLTVDTESDFKLCQMIYNALYQKFNTKFGHKEVLIYLNKNIKLVKEMTVNIEENEK